jgi:hypothetical protein
MWHQAAQHRRARARQSDSDDPMILAVVMVKPTINLR